MDIKKVLTLLTILYLVACSRDIPYTSKDDFSDKLLIFGDTVSGAEALEKSYVTCSDENCPQAMAQITVSNESGRGHGVCSAFLIAPDLLMTNSHCIPSYLQNPKQSCEMNLVANFPALKQQGKKKEKIFCKEIIYKENTDIGIDYALIKLQEKVNRRPFLLEHQQGVAESEIIATWNMTPDHDSPFLGKIEYQECKVVYQSFLRPKFNHPHYPYITLGNCHIVGGNSGSPILDKSGTVKGIINIKYDNDFLADMAKSYPSLYPNGLTNFAGALNFSCIPMAPYASRNQQNAPLCRFKEIIMGKINPIFKKNLEQESSLTQKKINIKKRLLEMRPPSNHLLVPETILQMNTFKWSHFYQDTGQGIFLAPSCIQDLDREKTTREWELPFLNILNEFNKYGQRKSQRKLSFFDITVTQDQPLIMSIKNLNEENPFILTREIKKCQ